MYLASFLSSKNTEVAANWHLMEEKIKKIPSLLLKLAILPSFKRLEKSKFTHHRHQHLKVKEVIEGQEINACLKKWLEKFKDILMNFFITRMETLPNKCASHDAWR